jgi:alanine-synthesizing transaminase
MAKETIKLTDLIPQVVTDVEALRATFGNFETHESQQADLAKVQAVLAELVERLDADNPYFHPSYAAQMLKPPHAVAVAAYLATMIINPNNPTGAVYSPEILREIADFAVERNLIVMADEIYDKILYDDAVHTTFAAIAPDVFTLTFSGLSKAYRLAGFRAAWMVMTGPRKHATSYIEGITMLTNMRLCANVPAQHAIQTALGGRQSIKDLVLPGGRLLEQRNAAITALRKIPGVSCVEPKGALYVFPKLDPNMYPIADDRKFVLDLLRAEHVLVVQGTGFNWPTPDHLRIVTLPWATDLTEAIGRIGNFLSTY